MLVFASTLTTACEKVNIKVPSDSKDFDPDEYPHFNVFCNVQLCRPCKPGEHFENAKIIALFNEAQIQEVTLNHLVLAGFEYHSFTAYDIPDEFLPKCVQDLKDWGIPVQKFN